jgi:hypothetical protein
LECKLTVVLMGKDRDSESEFRNGALRDGQRDMKAQILKQRLTLREQMIRVLLPPFFVMAHCSIYTWPSHVIRHYHVHGDVLHAGRTSSLQAGTVRQVG